MDKSTGIDDLGPPNPELIVCGLITYTLLYLSLFKGVKSSGNLELIVCGLITYTLLYLSLFKGVKSSGKLSYIRRELIRYQTKFFFFICIFFMKYLQSPSTNYA